MATVAGMAVSLAPILRRLVKEISLIIKELRFYPAVSWDGQKWLQLGNRVIEVDDLIFAGNYQVNEQGLNSDLA
mgnify:CR=1 FL=1